MQKQEGGYPHTFTSQIERYGNMSTNRKIKRGLVGRLDGLGNPVIGRPMPPPNWTRTHDMLSRRTLPIHWVTLAGFLAWFAYLV